MSENLKSIEKKRNIKNIISFMLQGDLKKIFFICLSGPEYGQKDIKVIKNNLEETKVFSNLTENYGN